MANVHPESSIPDDMRKELTDAFGFVPSFARTLPPAQARLWWNGMKDFQLSERTALSGKVKELIGLGVAAQIPCHYCVLFHTEAARLNGATDQEIEEAVFMSSLTRMGSTVLNGVSMDPQVFDKELEDIVAYLKTKGGASRQQAPGARR